MRFAALALIAGLLMIAIPANAGVTAGTHDAPYWASRTTVEVEAGTGFQLISSGDADIIFYDANGFSVGFALACGNDGGVVPAAAVTGEVRQWSMFSFQDASCANDDYTTVPTAGWLYVDGLPTA